MDRDDMVIKAARAIAVLAYKAYDAVLCGRPTGIQSALYAFMKDVQPGRLVVEITALGRPDRDPFNSVGELIRIAAEPVVFSDPEFVWDEKEEGRPAPTEQIFYIRLLDGTEYRWSNATFICVPETLDRTSL